MRRAGSWTAAVLAAATIVGRAPAMPPVNGDAAPPGPLETAALVMRLFDAGDADAIARMYALGAEMSRGELAGLLAAELRRAPSGMRVRPVRAFVDGDLAVVLCWRHQDDESLGRTLRNDRLVLAEAAMLRDEHGIWRMLPPRPRIDGSILDAAGLTRLETLMAVAEDGRDETKDALRAARREPTAAFLRTVLPAGETVAEVLGTDWIVRPTMVVGDAAAPAPAPGDLGVPPDPVLEAMAAQGILGIAKATYVLPGPGGSDGAPGRAVVATVTCHDTARDAARTVERVRWRRLREHDTWGVPWDRMDVEVLADEGAAHWHAHVERWIVEVQATGEVIGETDRVAGWAVTEEILRRLSTGPSTRDGGEAEEIDEPEALDGLEEVVEPAPPSPTSSSGRAVEEPVVDPVLVTGLTSLLPDAEAAAAATGVRWSRRLRLLVSNDEPGTEDGIPPAARRLLDEPGARRLVHVEYVDQDRPERRIATVIVAFDRSRDAGEAYPSAFAADPTHALVHPGADPNADDGRLYAVLGRYTIDSRRLGDWRGPELAPLHAVILRRAMARLEAESGSGSR